MQGPLALLAACVLCACSGSSKDDGPTAVEPTQTHGFVSVEQHLSSLGDVEPDTAALFVALRMPLTVTPSRMLRLMGMGNDLPEPGTCEVFDSTNQAGLSLSAYERVELLDVGDLSLATTKTNKFIRQAFPTVADSISGVLYTTRYRAVEPGKENPFALKSRGSGSLAAFNVAFAPLKVPEQLTLEGIAFFELARLQAQPRAELRWLPGQPSDSIWVELQTDTSHKTLNCAFDDAAGVGVIPTDLLGETGDARITVHRVHRQQISVPHLDSTELYMDVRFSQPLVIY